MTTGAMLPDVIGHDAARHGPGRAGAFGGKWTAGETAGIVLSFSVVPAALVLVSLVVLARYRLRRGDIE